jgi:hypothetical protein
MLRWYIPLHRQHSWNFYVNVKSLFYENSEGYFLQIYPSLNRNRKNTHSKCNYQNYPSRRALFANCEGGKYYLSREWAEVTLRQHNGRNMPRVMPMSWDPISTKSPSASSAGGFPLFYFTERHPCRHQLPIRVLLTFDGRYFWWSRFVEGYICMLPR